eukprot:200453-Pelagomonas_calceolata.AAC.9
MERAGLSDCTSDAQQEGQMRSNDGGSKAQQLPRRAGEKANDGESQAQQLQPCIKDKPGWYQAPAVFLLRRPRIFTANSSSTSHIPIPLSLVPIKAEKLLRGKF